MNSREIVDLLLERDQPSAGPVSASDSTGVYVFGAGLPAEGYATSTVETAIEEFRRNGIIPKEAADSAGMVEQLVGSGYTFFIKKPGGVEVIGKIPARTTPEGQERAEQFLGLDRLVKVQYRRHPRGSSQEMDAANVLFGSKQLEVANAPAETPETAPGKDEDMLPINAPLQIGVTFDLDSKTGVIVREVHPSGPAAQAGLQAGDTIVEVGKFARNDRQEPKAYGILNSRHLEFVLKTADPQYPIPFRVIRGDREHWLPIIGKPKQQQKPQPNPVQAAVRPQPQPQAPAPQPNEPSPSRETGNPQANVSSIT